MTVNAPAVVVTYAEFVERRERRLRVASELRRMNAERTIEGEAVACPAPAPREQERRDEDPSRPKISDCAT